MPAVPHTRERDRKHLLWVKARCHGWTAARIASLFGTTPDDVRTATKRIRAADAAESGEDVADAYRFVDRGKNGRSR